MDAPAPLAALAALHAHAQPVEYVSSRIFLSAPANVLCIRNKILSNFHTSGPWTASEPFVFSPILLRPRPLSNPTWDSASFVLIETDGSMC